MKVDFFRHNLDDIDIQNVNRALRDNILTTGKTTEEFEMKLAKYLTVNHVVGVMSCTHALELGLAGVGVGPGDEVITTPMTYIATTDAIEYVGARPVFVDVEEATGNINADLIERAITSKTKAILPVHLYGQMCDMGRIRAIADKYHLKVIEDAAHCLEGERDGVRPGQLGDVACFSFYATKSITCGEGGALAVNSDGLAEWCKKARGHGLSKDMHGRFGNAYKHYEKDFLGFKCNMSNIQAALLIGQLGRVEEMRERREEIAKIYNDSFEKNKKVRVPAVLSGTNHGRHLYAIWVDPMSRDKILEYLFSKDIGIVVTYQPVHLMKYYREKYSFRDGDYPVAEKIGAATISLPFYAKLTNDEVSYVARCVLEAINL